MGLVERDLGRWRGRGERGDLEGLGRGIDVDVDVDGQGR